MTKKINPNPEIPKKTNEPYYIEPNIPEIFPVEDPVIPPQKPIHIPPEKPIIPKKNKRK